MDIRYSTFDIGSHVISCLREFNFVFSSQNFGTSKRRKDTKRHEKTRKDTKRHLKIIFNKMFCIIYDMFVLEKFLFLSILVVNILLSRKTGLPKMPESAHKVETEPAR